MTGTIIKLAHENVEPNLFVRQQIIEWRDNVFIGDLRMRVKVLNVINTH